MHNIVLQNNLVELGTGIPAIDNIAYGQAIDDERDTKEANDDKRIPDELKDLALNYLELNLEPDALDIIGDFLVQLAKSNERNSV